MRSWDPRTRSGGLSWLLVACFAYAVLAFSLSEARYLELHATAWDLGLYQQSLWSTAHGAPFYESGDYEVLGTSSLLEIHSAFVLYPLVPLYTALPNPSVLFALQAIAVALAAVPLYGIARSLALPPERSLAVAVLYLAFVPVIAGNLYDFHVESFVPIEVFTLTWFWIKGRYWEGAGVALLGMVTLEAAGGFAALVALFFLLPPLRRTAGLALDALLARDRDRRVTARSSLVQTLRGAFTSQLGKASTALFLGSTVGFVAVRAIQAFVLPGLLGVPIPPQPDGFLVGESSTDLALSSANLVLLIPRTEYWVLLYALVAGLPLFAPRTAILSLPWVGLTVLSSDPTFTALGYQYGLLSSIPLMIGVCYGLRNLPSAVPALAPSRREPSPAPSGGAGEGHSGAGPPRPRWRPGAFATVVVLALAFNVLLSPIDPLVQGSGGAPGYQVSYDLSSGFSTVSSVAALVPTGATVLSSDDLFPFVANDVHSFVLDPNTTQGYTLPFSGADLPPYVLLSQERIFEVPAWLSDTLYNRSDYGVRGMGFDTSDGAVGLFELGYRGPTATWSPPMGNEDYRSSDLWVGTAASRVRDPNVPGGEGLESLPGATGNLWYGPYASLDAGSYTVTVSVRAWTTGSAGTLPRGTAVLQVDSSAFATPLFFNAVVPFGAFASSGWTSFSYDLNLTEPVMNFEVRGNALNASVAVEVAGVDVAPVD